jgi:endonuclease-3
MDTKEELKERAQKIAEVLAKAHPAPKTELVFKNDYQLVISVMLSAQTTDKKVNQVTPKLFDKYKDWEALASATPDEVAPFIHAVNFHKSKSERLVKAAQFILSEYHGDLPRTLEQLVKIPGIARKSGNVILQELWDIAEGIVVDTHITRVSQRLGLTKNTDAVKIEKELMDLLPKKYWRNYSGAVVLHGRYVCTARKPKCAECILNTLCPSAFKV